ncbi:MAG: hypothetical protein ABIT69_08390 [Sphingomicrobium sp.]
MSTAASRPNWTARLAWGLLLLIAGAGLATWGLARWQSGARFFGVAPPPPIVRPAAPLPLAAPPPAASMPVNAVETARIATLETRLSAVENATQRAEGTAGRANALLVAFAARRAIERGVALGYLEPLLAERFGATHERAVATVVTAGRTPQTLDSLIADFDRLGPVLRGPAPDEDWWTGVRRELGTLASIHRADKPNPLPQARYDRASAALRTGKVAAALAETMRLPGASRPEAAEWIARARRQVMVTGALDELESAALLGGGGGDAATAR